MTVSIRTVTFNHAPGNLAASAMNVRRNFAQAAVLPEWRAGDTVEPEDSVAAYVIESVNPMGLLIEATFVSDDPTLRQAEIRAIELAWTDWVLTGGNVLGEVSPQLVRFDAQGSGGPTTFRLTNVRLRSRGCGVSNVFWRWQFRLGPADPWRDAGVTAHRIYATLGIPTSPWILAPFEAANTQLPWTDVLEYACTWAAGRTTRQAILANITQAVYELGDPPKSGVIEYGCPVNAVTMYAQSFFNCSAFLDRLRGGIGNGRYVNCTDCAAFVATFANILGCDVWESRMGEYRPPFACNPFMAIGTGVWNVPCGVPGGFLYHEVAWTGACDNDDAVCDACIGFSGLTTFPPPEQVPILAVLTRFGRSGQGGYRDALAAPSARETCRPRPAERVRRPIF